MKKAIKIIEGRSGGLLVLSFYIVFALFMTFPLLLHMSDSIPGSLGDPYYTIWVMSWNTHAFFNSSENLLDTNIFYPHKKTLYYADPLFFESALSALLKLVWKNPIFVYNLLFLFSFVLCGVGMYWLVFHLTGSRGAAFLAGLIFSYFPNKFAHLAHLEILFFGWIPFMFLFLHRFFERPKYKYLLGFIFFYVLQAISCTYYTVFITLFILIFIVYFAFQKGWFLKKDFWIKMAAASLLLAVLLIPLYFPYISVSQEMSFSRSLEEVKFYSAQLEDFFSVPPWNRAYKKWLGGMIALEQQVFPGAIPLLLVVFWWLSRKRGLRKRSLRKKVFLLWDSFHFVMVLFISWLSRGGGFDLSLAGKRIASVHSIRNPLILLGISLVLRIYADRKNLSTRLTGLIKIPLRKRLGPKNHTESVLSQNFYFFSALLAVLLVLGPVITAFGQEIIAGPYSLFYTLFPGFKALRVPPRFVAVAMFGLAVLGSWGVAGLIKKKASSFWKYSILFLLGGLIAGEYVSLPIPLVRAQKREELPPIYETVKKLPEKAVILKYPLPREKEIFKDGITLYNSIFHRKRLVNGFSAFSPPGYRIIHEAMELFPSNETFALLNDLGVDYVLVETSGYRPWLAKFAVERLGKSPQYAELIERQENDHLYRLIHWASESGEPDVMAEVGRRTLWKATANKNSEMARSAFDGDLETAWNSEFHQENGDFFSLDLGEILRIRRLELYNGEDFLNFPRGYRLEGSIDGQNWARLSERRVNFPKLTPSTIQDISRYRVEISFGEIEVRYLKVTLTKTFEKNNWSIREIVCR